LLRAGLALHAAAHDLPIAKLVLHEEPPYVPDEEEERRTSQEYAENLKSLLAQGHRGDAVELFMTTLGTPPEVIGQLRNEPWWAGMEAIAPTLAYDSEVMGDSRRGGTIPVDLVGRVPLATLVLSGGASPGSMIDIGRQLADAMRTDGTVSWRARNTPCPPSCSHRCWRSSSPKGTALATECRAESRTERSRHDQPTFLGRLRAGERSRDVL
jgi:hypothetical protein